MKREETLDCQVRHSWNSLFWHPKSKETRGNAGLPGSILPEIRAFDIPKQRKLKEMLDWHAHYSHKTAKMDGCFTRISVSSESVDLL